MKARIPILSLRLLNESLRPGAGGRIDRLVKAKDLLRCYPERCVRQGVDRDLFHSEHIRYSGIQVGDYQGAVEWTAIGVPAVNALVLWYRLAQQEALIDTGHVVEITEFYSPSFLDYPQAYRIDNFVLSKNLRQELGKVADSKEKKLRLEKYLFGNIMRFFHHIGFSYDKQKHFLKVNVRHVRQSRNPSPVFRGRQILGYQVDCSLNFRLPQTLRLGQSTALGYGKVSTTGFGIGTGSKVC